MNRRVSRATIISALLAKEWLAYRRDTLYLALTGAVIVLIVVLARVLPDTVDESITMGVSPPLERLTTEARAELVARGASAEMIEGLVSLDATERPGLVIVDLPSEEALADVVKGSVEAWRIEDGTIILRDRDADEPEPKDAERIEIDVGIAFPEHFMRDLVRGESGVAATVYADADVPEEIRDAMAGFVRELGYAFAGRQLPVTMPDERTIIVGTDRSGAQASLRDKLIPMFAFLVLLMETFSMSSLISAEVSQRTAQAVLVTPARVSDLLAAKTLFGSANVLAQGLVVLVLVGALTSTNWPVMLSALLLGALMFTGIAMLVGSAGKDFMDQLFYSMLFVIPLLIPAFSVLFPGTAAPWVRALPSYPVIDTLVAASLYGAGFSEVSWRLLYGAAWVVVIHLAGLIALARKVVWQ